MLRVAIGILRDMAMPAIWTSLVGTGLPMRRQCACHAAAAYAALRSKLSTRPRASRPTPSSRLSQAAAAACSGEASQCQPAVP
jgi:hypothetical protein